MLKPQQGNLRPARPPIDPTGLDANLQLAQTPTGQSPTGPTANRPNWPGRQSPTCSNPNRAISDRSDRQSAQSAWTPISNLLKPQLVNLRPARPPIGSIGLTVQPPTGPNASRHGRQNPKCPTTKVTNRHASPCLHVRGDLACEPILHMRNDHARGKKPPWIPADVSRHPPPPQKRPQTTATHTPR